MSVVHLSFLFFFFNDTATTEIYTLSLHDALPIYVLGEAGGDVDVLVAVQIEVRHEHAPAPVRPGHAGHLADVRERAVAVVEMQHVAGKLEIETVAHLGLQAVPAFERGCGLEAGVGGPPPVRPLDNRA